MEFINIKKNTKSTSFKTMNDSITNFKVHNESPPHHNSEFIKLSFNNKEID